MHLIRLYQPLAKLTRTHTAQPVLTNLRTRPIRTLTMRPDISFTHRPAAAIRANFHSPPASPLATLEPDELAHVITELQDPETKQRRKDTLLSLLGFVREADDPATHVKPKPSGEVKESQESQESQESLGVEVASDSLSEVEAGAERDGENEGRSKRDSYTITGETGRPCPRERLMG